MKRFYQYDFYIQLGLFLLSVAMLCLHFLAPGLQYKMFTSSGSLLTVLYLVPAISYIIRCRQAYPKDYIFKLSGIIVFLQLTAPIWIIFGFIFIYKAGLFAIPVLILLVILWFIGRGLYVFHTYTTYRQYGPSGTKEGADAPNDASDLSPKK
ncbi:hypothetical protein DBR32_00820 [Taibaiella sp. KBW10]|uniref:hypothetical protein n=1 Tax=Taibaiella sp. KBW10 TaxID=2153357 RepID=UPI000F5A99CF|nr:hypothetical protein [Taibaiella sp. KBW10]RQO32189.1 hypothetical protein DBR32_00820 [Taibaiella sp. KBW10]